MCYPKPGPRCSAHAAVALSDAKHRYEREQRSGSWDDVVRLSEAVGEAQRAYDATPAGLKVLESEYDSYPNENLLLRLDAAKRLRVEQLKEYAAVSPVQHVGRSVKRLGVPSGFSDSVRVGGSEGLPERLSEHSVAWLERLSDDELAAVRWMTDRGAMAANTHIAGATSYGKPEKDVETRMKSVDSALKKYEHPEPVVVYRGVRKGYLPENMQDDYRIPEEAKQATFLENYQVGSVVGNQFYMPTSFDSSVAYGFSDFGVVFEIKTRHAAPVNVLSVSAVENEGLVGRGNQFRVVAVKDAEYQLNPRFPDTHTVKVVQLEEL